MPEITPTTKTSGICRYNPDGKGRKKFTKKVEARAVLEG